MRPVIPFLFLLAALVGPQEDRISLRLIVRETEAEALELRERALEGPLSFGALAREYSIDPTAGDGGYLGQVDPEDLRPEFRAAVERLGPGGLSEATPVDGAWVLIWRLTPEEGTWMARNDAGLEALGQGRDAEALELFMAAVAAAGDFGDDRLATSLHNLAVVHARQESYAEARSLWERSTAILEETYGPRHREVAASLDNLATIYELEGDFEEAGSLYQRAIEIARDALGPEDPNVAASLNNLAGLRELQGDYAEAAALYESALGILERTVGGEHASTLAVAAELGKFPSFPRFTCQPEMTFCNLASAAGLDSLTRYGRGAAWVDIDGDGWDDLFLADSDNRWDPDTYGVSMFFLNQRDGTFAPVPATALGIEDSDLVSTWSGSFADYDNDGDADLLLANGGYSGLSNLALYENRIALDEGYVRVTESSGVGAANLSASSWWGSSWADYDNDGWLDFVATRTEGVALLFHNNGDGTFREVGADLGVGVPMEDGKNPLWLDYDNDGDPDLYLAGMWQHVFYRNDGGAFTDVTAAVFPEPFPYPDIWLFPPIPVVFTAAADDFDQDGFDDLYFGRWDLQDLLLLNDGAGRFRQHSTDWGIDTGPHVASDWLQEASSSPSSEVYLRFENTMGLGVGDLFDDGRPDVLIGTGSPARAAPDLVFCNTADRSFYRCTNDVYAGVDGVWRTRSHGTVFSDFDHDGDTDVAVNLGGHPDFDVEAGRVSTERPALFVNQRGPAGNTASLTLVGTRSNRDALGARIRVEGEDTRYYTVRSMQAFQSQNSRTQTVSLGSRTGAGVEIRWPSGTVQAIEIGAGDRITVTEP